MSNPEVNDGELCSPVVCARWCSLIIHCMRWMSLSPHAAALHSALCLSAPETGVREESCRRPPYRKCVGVCVCTVFGVDDTSQHLWMHIGAHVHVPILAFAQMYTGIRGIWTGMLHWFRISDRSVAIGAQASVDRSINLRCSEYAISSACTVSVSPNCRRRINAGDLTGAQRTTDDTGTEHAHRMADDHRHESSITNPRLPPVAPGQGCFAPSLMEPTIALSLSI